MSFSPGLSFSRATTYDGYRVGPLVSTPRGARLWYRLVPVTEKEGCEILRRCFTEVGLAIQEAFDLRAEGVAVSLDGFDPARRVGYEFITTEAGDRAEVTADVIATLDERMEKGELFVFLIDERDVPDAASLEKAAGRFLDVVRARGALS